MWKIFGKGGKHREEKGNPSIGLIRRIHGVDLERDETRELQMRPFS